METFNHTYSCKGDENTRETKEEVEMKEEKSQHRETQKVSVNSKQVNSNILCIDVVIYSTVQL